jgi:NADH-quinone oxidoreductase subunit J
MIIIFYIASIIAIIATAMVVTGKNAFHALLYLVVSLLSVAVIFFILGAPFVAALEVIVYAGAIMVLIVFAIMMLNLGKDSEKNEREWYSLKAWIGPGILCLILLAEIIYVIYSVELVENTATVIGPQQVGISLFGPYILAVELTAMLLMAGIIGAYHIGSEKQKEHHRFLQKENEV